MAKAQAKRASAAEMSLPIDAILTIGRILKDGVERDELLPLVDGILAVLSYAAHKAIGEADEAPEPAPRMTGAHAATDAPEGEPFEAGPESVGVSSTSAEGDPDAAQAAEPTKGRARATKPAPEFGHEDVLPALTRLAQHGEASGRKGALPINWAKVVGWAVTTLVNVLARKGGVISG